MTQFIQFHDCVTVVPHIIIICDRACENRPCEHKLHRVIFFTVVPQVAEEIPLHSAVVMKILLQ